MVMTTGSVYKPHEDPNHAYPRPIRSGDCNLPSVPTYSVSKIAEEGVARTMARLLNLPTVIVRMNVAYGANGGMPAFHLDAVAAGKPVSCVGTQPLQLHPRRRHLLADRSLARCGVGAHHHRQLGRRPSCVRAGVVCATSVNSPENPQSSQLCRRRARSRVW